MTTPTLFEIDERPLVLEKSLWKEGLHVVAGVDEAGRGALAGPVVAAAVVFPSSQRRTWETLRDSKKLDAEKREALYEKIVSRALTFGVGIVEPAEIDRLNILRASLHAMKLAVAQLDPSAEICLVDGNQAIPILIPQRVIVKGDDRVSSISAASILAKVTRDRLMTEYDRTYPAYGFSQHKGYGTPDHLAALEKVGPCDLHRMTFAGCAPTP